jgi:hypothetical protein
MRRAWVATCAVAAVLLAGLAPAVAGVQREAERDRATRPDPVALGTITGTVRGPDGNGLPNVRVVGHVLEPDGWRSIRDATDGGWYDEFAILTRADGTYSLSLLHAPGAYRVEFRPPMHGVSSEFSGAFWGDEGTGLVRDSQDVQVGADEVVTGIDVTLEPTRGTIVGSVLERDPDEGRQSIELLRDGYWLGRFMTDDEGRYAFPADPGVPYRIFMQPHDVATAKYWWHPSAASEADAEDIVVAPLGSADGSILPVTDGRYFAVVSGRVTDPDGEPLPSTMVQAVQEFPDGRFDHNVGHTNTRADGSYDLRLPPGRHRICVPRPIRWLSNYESIPYVPRCWDGARRLAGATTLELGQGERRADVDVRADELGASLSIGTSTSGVSLSPFRWSESDGKWLAEGGAAHDWRFVFRPGRYRLRFGDDHWWPSGRTIDDAADIWLQAGEREEIEVLPRPSCTTSISGSVTDLDGDQVGDPRIRLLAVDENGDPLPFDDPGHVPGPRERYGNFSWPRFTSTTWTFSHLQPGRYRVLHDRQELPGYGHLRKASRAWWPDSAVLGEAATIEVGPGEAVSGVDFTESPGAIVSGAVTDSDGRPTPNLLVVFERYDELERRWVFEESTATDHAGRFASATPTNDDGRLRSGDHRIRIESPWHAGLGSSWWTTEEDATPAVFRTEPRQAAFDVGTVVVGTGEAGPNDDPPPALPVEGSTATVTRTPCEPTPPPVPTPDPTESGLPTSTSPSSPVPTPSASPTPTPVVTPPGQRRGRLTVRSPRGNVIVVRNRESVKVRIVVGGRRSTVGPGARLRLRFGRSAVTWRARWTDPDLLPLRGRTRVR